MTVFTARGLEIKYRPRLKINEIFHSVQGEGRHAGLPCTFIRLTGCALRCTYCDTEYAFYGGRWEDFDALHAAVAANGSKLVQITGGEPLHQRAVWPFIDQLIERGYQPLVETSGAVTIAGLHADAHIVLDLKTPASGESARNLWENLDLLKPSDEVKFVVCDDEDLAWSFARIREHHLADRFEVLISPVAEMRDKAAVAEAVVASGLSVRFQVQLHKILWGEERGR